jgi:chromosomal replication initiation ATPase DnaA
MDILRQSMTRAQLAKPLPPGPATIGAQKPGDSRASDMTEIDARFSALDRKLDALIHMLKGPDRKQGALGHLLPTDVRRAVEDFFDVTEQDLDRRDRSKRIGLIRQVAYYLCRTQTNRTLNEIGRVLGGRDHSTILHGVRRIRRLRKTDAGLDSDLRQIEARLAEILKRRVTA